MSPRPIPINPNSCLGRRARICKAGSGVTNGKERNLLDLHIQITPVPFAVFPLMKKPAELQKISRKIYEDLIENDISAIYDAAGSIGKRYRRTEEIGVRYAFTIDHQSIEDNTVTIRNIEDMSQKRVKIDELIQLATNLLHNKATFAAIPEI